MAGTRVTANIPLQTFQQSHLSERTESTKVGLFNSSLKLSYEKLNKDWLARAADFDATLNAQHSKGTFPFDHSTAKKGYDSVEKKMTKKIKGESDKNMKTTQRFEFKYAVDGALELALMESTKASPSLKIEPKKIMEGITWLAHVDSEQAIELAKFAKHCPCMGSEFSSHPHFIDDLRIIADSQQSDDELNITTDRVNTLSVKEESGDAREAQLTMSLVPKMKQVYTLPEVPEDVSRELELKMQCFTFRPRPHVTAEQRKPDKIPLFPSALNTVAKFNAHLELVLNGEDTSSTIDQLSRLHTVCFWAVDTLNGVSGSDKMVTYLKSVHTLVKQCINDKGCEIIDVEPNPRWTS